jgi:hypothetical protein
MGAGLNGPALFLLGQCFADPMPDWSTTFSITSVGARVSRLNLAKNLVAGPGVLPNRLSNNPIASSPEPMPAARNLVTLASARLSETSAHVLDEGFGDPRRQVQGLLGHVPDMSDWRVTANQKRPLSSTGAALTLRKGAWGLKNPGGPELSLCPDHQKASYQKGCRVLSANQSPRLSSCSN